MCCPKAPQKRKSESPYSMTEKPLSVLKIALLRGSLFCLFALFVSLGCSKLSAGNNKEEGATRWICDKGADEAMERDDYGTGIRLHEELLEREPENPLAMYHLGYAYGQTGDHRKEVHFYEKAIALGFKTEQIFFNMGMAYGELDETEKSINGFKRALSMNPDNADYHFGLAMAYMEVMDRERAEEELLKVIEIDQVDMEARLLLSRLYVEWGKRQKADEQIQEVLKMDPMNEEARKILESMRRK